MHNFARAFRDQLTSLEDIGMNTVGWLTEVAARTAPPSTRSVSAKLGANVVGRADANVFILVH